MEYRFRILQFTYALVAEANSINIFTCKDDLLEHPTKVLDNERSGTSFSNLLDHNNINILIFMARYP